MTIHAYTTDNVTADTIANAMIVMEAYRASGDKLIENFSQHKAIDIIGQTAEDGIQFKADTSSLNRAISMTINNGPAFEIGVNTPVTPAIKSALAAAPKAAHKSAKPKPSSAPKR